MRNSKQNISKNDILLSIFNVIRQLVSYRNITHTCKNHNMSRKTKLQNQNKYYKANACGPSGIISIIKIYITITIHLYLMPSDI